LFALTTTIDRNAVLGGHPSKYQPHPSLLNLSDCYYSMYLKRFFFLEFLVLPSTSSPSMVGWSDPASPPPIPSRVLRTGSVPRVQHLPPSPLSRSAQIPPRPRRKKSPAPRIPLPGRSPLHPRPVPMNKHNSCAHPFISKTPPPTEIRYSLEINPDDGVICGDGGAFLLGSALFSPGGR
jgi:hypothetical protein